MQHDYPLSVASKFNERKQHFAEQPDDKDLAILARLRRAAT